MGLTGERTFEDGEKHLSTLGTFWSRVFSDGDVLVELFNGLGVLAGDAMFEQALQTLVNNNQTIPLAGHKQWHLLEISGDTRSDYPARFVGSALEFGAEATFGETGDPKVLYLPSTISDVSMIVDNPAAPTTTLVAGIHFIVADGKIWFTEQYIPATGDVSLWLWSCATPNNYVYERLGRIFGMKFDSTEFYRAFMNAVWGLAVVGPLASLSRAALASAVGIPVADCVGSVLGSTTWNGNVYVRTDSGLMKYAAGCVPCDADTVVLPGMSVVNAMTITEGSVLPPSVTRIVIPPNIIHTVRGALVFDNMISRVTRYADGSLSFPIVGAAEDIAAFWAGVDFSKLPPIGQTINPAEFAYEVLKHNSVIIQIDGSKIQDDAPGLAALSALTQYLSPHIRYFIQVTSSISSTAVSIDVGVGAVGVAGNSVSTASAEATSPQVKLQQRVISWL